MLYWIWFIQLQVFVKVRDTDQCVMGTLLKLLKFIKITKNSIINQGDYDEQLCYGEFGTYLVQPYMYCILGLIAAFHTLFSLILFNSGHRDQIECSLLGGFSKPRTAATQSLDSGLCSILI